MECLYHYIFRLVCFRHKLLSVPYFCDEMPLYELDDIADNLKYCDTIQWEQTRLIAYILAKANFKNIKKLTEFLPLPSDEEVKKKAAPMTDAEINRLKRLSETWKN